MPCGDFYEVLLTSSNKSGNCWKHSWNDIVPVKKLYCKSVHRAGFEPASPKREQLKCSALDHSAIDAIMILPAGFEPAALRLPCWCLSTHIKVWCSTDWAKGALLHGELVPEGTELGISVFPECQSVFPVCQSSFRIVIKIQFFSGPTETLSELESSKVPPENHILSS